MKGHARSLPVGKQCPAGLTIIQANNYLQLRAQKKLRINILSKEEESHGRMGLLEQKVEKFRGLRARGGSKDTSIFFFAFQFALFSSDPLIIFKVLWPDPGLSCVVLMCGSPLERCDLPEVLHWAVADLPGWGSRADSCVLAACHTTSLAQVSAEAGRAVRIDSLCVFHRRGIWGLALGRGL